MFIDMVQCKVTGIWYDSASEFEKLLNTKEIIDLLKRLKNR